MVSKAVNVHNYMKVYYPHRIQSMCFGQSCGNSKGVHYKEYIHWDFTETLNECIYIKYYILKTIHGLKCMLQIKKRIKIFVVDSDGKRLKCM